MVTFWFIVIGALLILMALLGSVVERLPLSTGVIYLLIGVVLGSSTVGMLSVDIFTNSVGLELAFEVAVLISLFTVGLKLRLPFSDPLWWLPVRLASVSMLITVGALTLVGVYLLALPLGAAVLFGAILAPTDPVLASDIQLRHAHDRDRVRFSLTAEGGMNDGTAFPFVFLGLGLLGLHELGSSGWRWVVVDVLWGICGGLAVGWVCGRSVGKLVLYLRHKLKEPVGLEEFLTLGLIALSYGLALLIQSLGFLSVLAAGLAMRRIESNAPGAAQTSRAPSVEPVVVVDGMNSAKGIRATVTAPGQMVQGVLGFNERFERIAELVAVLLLGGLLAAGYFAVQGIWIALLLFLLIRPASVVLGLVGAKWSLEQLGIMSWFGIRGVGSLYYMAYAVNHGLDEGLAERLVPLILTVVATSIVLHGISATPLMDIYAPRKQKGRTRTG